MFQAFVISVCLIMLGVGIAIRGYRSISVYTRN